MRRKLTTLKAKLGNPLTAPRSLLDDALYREHRAMKQWDVGFSSYRNATRPRDLAITLRSTRTSFTAHT